MAAFWVVNNQFQKFIDSQFTLDYDSQITDKYFVEYTGIEVKHFRDTLLQRMGNVKKFVAERTRHQRQYDRGLYGNEAIILKESLMMLLVSNVMEFGVDVTDNNNNRICYTFLEREEAVR
ncbi:hypothetical protein Tco_0657821 [Tanacetum coccineum]